MDYASTIFDCRCAPNFPLWGQRWTEVKWKTGTGTNNPNKPVSFEEVGLSGIFPPDGCLNTLCGHAATEQRNVLRVGRLKMPILEHPETVSWNTEIRLVCATTWNHTKKRNGTTPACSCPFLWVIFLHEISQTRCFISLFKDYLRSTKCKLDGALKATLLSLVVLSLIEVIVAFNSIWS